MDEQIHQFMAITTTESKQVAQDYLTICDNDLDRAIQFYYENGGSDLGAMQSSMTPSTQSTSASRFTGQSGNNGSPVHIPSDEDEDEDAAMARLIAATTDSASHSPGAGDDEEIARRLQQQFDSERNPEPLAEELRAPIAPSRSTLVGGPEDMMNMPPPGHFQAPRMRQPHRPGIFNQAAPSRQFLWDAADAESSRRRLAEATGGASEQSSKQNRLAQLYQPPFDIITNQPWDMARSTAKDSQKWILVNIQDSTVFDSQTLNRDIWKDQNVKDTVKENFVFLQYQRQSPDGQTYIRLYLPQAGLTSDAFPHVGIVDPRTGESVKVWETAPKDAIDFVMDLHDFLGRYSLDHSARNPVAKTSKPKSDVEHMTEDEMLDLALRNSLGNGDGISKDPDELTKINGKGKQGIPSAVPVLESQNSNAPLTPPETEESEDPDVSIFRSIQARSHPEPDAGSNVTRIQFRLPNGTRNIRRFILDSPVLHVFEFVKAELVPQLDEGKKDQRFELVAMKQNLLQLLDSSIEAAGLKNGTVMVEFMDD